MGAARILVISAGVLVVIGAGGVAGAHFGRQAVEGIVRDYILDHPEILPEAMANLQRREGEKQLAGVRPMVENPYPGMVMGNPNGSQTLVEFTDFACGYCRQSVADVQRLIAEDPSLRVVVRQLPVISPLSPDASKMGMAAALQGKYPQFHEAMFQASSFEPETIREVAQGVGVDLARADAAMADPAMEEELRRNIAIADRLGFNGTPSWIANGTMLSGAVGHDRLREALDTPDESPDG